MTEDIVVFSLPTADFAFTSNNDFKEQSEITFENKSLDAESYSWKFGDGGTSTEENPTHAYNVAGTYTVELTANNNKGSDTQTAEITIHPLATEEQLQLTKLKGAWTLQTATANDTDRTGEFPSLLLTLGGNYVEGGTYNYSFTGTRPDPSPWPASGTWRFGTNKATEMIRDPGSSSEILMNYQVTETDLVISFTVPDGSSWAGGQSRVKTVTGDWTFTFTK